MTNHITLQAETIRLLSPACKAEIAAHLGLAAEADEQILLRDDSEEFAELGIQAARAFLQGCGEKTEMALRLIVEAGETFSMRALEEKMKVQPGALRGVWTGLTKRVRTITGDPEAALIKWGEETDDGDWIGRLMPVTREAFRRALAE
jgi:hypothetical protein